MDRSSGVLLHPTSLPGQYGIGEFNEHAYAFIDLLAATGQSLWQVLPLGPTGYGDSPYQCFSALAGNPLLVSPDVLRHEGLWSAADLAKALSFPELEVGFGAVIGFKRPILARAFAAFEKKGGPSRAEAFAGFRRANESWLQDFSLFMALKHANGGAAWHTWDRP